MLLSIACSQHHLHSDICPGIGCWDAGYFPKPDTGIHSKGGRKNTIRLQPDFFDTQLTGIINSSQTQLFTDTLSLRYGRNSHLGQLKLTYILLGHSVVRHSVVRHSGVDHRDTANYFLTDFSEKDLTVAGQYVYFRMIQLFQVMRFNGKITGYPLNVQALEIRLIIGRVRENGNVVHGGYELMY